MSTGPLGIGTCVTDGTRKGQIKAHSDHLRGFLIHWEGMPPRSAKFHRTEGLTAIIRSTLPR